MAGLLSFALSPLGKAGMILLALTVWTIYQREQAADKARQECQAEQLQKTVDEITRQRDAARKALEDAEKQQAATDKEMADLESDKNALLKELANAEKPAGGACRISPAVRERLRNIR